MHGHLVKTLLGILEVLRFPFIDYGSAKTFALGCRSHNNSGKVTGRVEVEIVAL
jgi:hypothetical protein